MPHLTQGKQLHSCHVAKSIFLFLKGQVAVMLVAVIPYRTYSCTGYKVFDFSWSMDCFQEVKEWEPLPPIQGMAKTATSYTSTLKEEGLSFTFTWDWCPNEKTATLEDLVTYFFIGFGWWFPCPFRLEQSMPPYRLTYDLWLITSCYSLEKNWKVLDR